MEVARRDSTVLKALDISFPLGQATVSPTMAQASPNSNGDATGSDNVSLPPIRSVTDSKEGATSASNTAGTEPQKQLYTLPPLSVSVPAECCTTEPATSIPVLRLQKQHDVNTANSSPSSQTAVLSPKMASWVRDLEARVVSAQDVRNRVWERFKGIKTRRDTDLVKKEKLERLKSFIARWHPLSGVSLGEELLWEFLATTDGRNIYGNLINKHLNEDAEWRSIGANVRKFKELREEGWINEDGVKKVLSHGTDCDTFKTWLRVLSRYISYSHARVLANRKVYERISRRQVNGRNISDCNFRISTEDVRQITMDILNMKAPSPPRPGSLTDVTQDELTKINAMFDQDWFLVKRRVDFTSPYAINNSDNTPQEDALRDNSHVIDSDIDEEFVNTVQETVDSIISEVSPPQMNETISAGKQSEEENGTSEARPVDTQTESSSASNQPVSVPPREVGNIVTIDLTQDPQESTIGIQQPTMQQETGVPNTGVDPEPDISAFVHEHMMGTPLTNESTAEVQPLNNQPPASIFAPPVDIAETWKEFELPPDHSEETPQPATTNASVVSDDLLSGSQDISGKAKRGRLRSMECQRIGDIVLHCLERDLGLKIDPKEKNKVLKPEFAKSHGYTIVAPVEINRVLKSAIMKWPNDIRAVFLPLLKDGIVKLAKPRRGGKLRVPNFDKEPYIRKAEEGVDGWEDEFGPRPTLRDVEAEHIAREALKAAGSTLSPAAEDAAEGDSVQEMEEAVQQDPEPADAVHLPVDVERPSRPIRKTRRIKRLYEELSSSEDDSSSAEEADDDGESPPEVPPTKRIRTTGVATRSSSALPSNKVTEQSESPKPTRPTKATSKAPSSQSQVTQSAKPLKPPNNRIVTRQSQEPSTSSTSTSSAPSSSAPRSSVPISFTPIPSTGTTSASTSSVSTTSVSTTSAPLPPIPQSAVLPSTTMTSSSATTSVSSTAQADTQDCRQPLPMNNAIPSPPSSTASLELSRQRISANTAISRVHTPAPTPAPTPISINDTPTPSTTAQLIKTPRSAKAIVTQISDQMTKLEKFALNNTIAKQLVEQPLAVLTDRKRSWKQFAQAEEEIEHLDIDCSILEMIKDGLRKMVDKEVAEKGIFSATG